MKKIYLFLAIMLLSCTVTTAFGQATKEERVQAILDKNQQKELYRAELEEAMLGLRMGGEYSFRTMGLIATKPANKHGLHYQIGYRFTEHWYVGGIVGVDLTTPFIIQGESNDWDEGQTYYNEFERTDKVYVPIMADVRFYFKPQRVSTYLFTNLGAEFSSITGIITLFGLGFDIHTVKSQCLNIGLAIGTSNFESIQTGLGGDYLDSFGKQGGFTFNLKLGYSF